MLSKLSSEEFEILSYREAYKLGCHSFIDAGRTHKTLDQRLYYPQHSRQCEFPLPLTCHGGERKQPGTCHTYSVFGSQLKNPDFWIPCLIKGLLAHLSNIFPRKIHYLYNPVRKQIYPLPPKEREVSLFSKSVWYTDILEKIVWNKAVSASYSENVQKHKRPEENCLPK